MFSFCWEIGTHIRLNLVPFAFSFVIHKKFIRLIVSSLLFTHNIYDFITIKIVPLRRPRWMGEAKLSLWLTQCRNGIISCCFFFFFLVKCVNGQIANLSLVASLSLPLRLLLTLLVLSLCIFHLWIRYDECDSFWVDCVVVLLSFCYVVFE